MARSHHRKKHKQHLKQFKQSRETTADAPASKSSATWVFGIAGAILGFAVGYFATGGNLLWAGLGLVAGAAVGYLVGRRIDEPKK